MATSPSDQNNKNVLAWLDRLQSSIRDAGSKTGPQAFRDLRDFENIEDDSEGESDGRTQAQIYATAAKDDGDDDNADESLGALPEAHVPIGLLADLSLSNSNANRKKDKPNKEGAALEEEDLNDNNVVRWSLLLFFQSQSWRICANHRVLQTKRTSCLVSQICCAFGKKWSNFVSQDPPQTLE